MSTASPDIAVAGFDLDLMSCTPANSREGMVARLQFKAGAQTFVVLVNARGYCLFPDGEIAPALKTAVEAEAQKIVAMALREAVLRGIAAAKIVSRLSRKTAAPIRQVGAGK